MKLQTPRPTKEPDVCVCLGRILEQNRGTGASRDLALHGCIAARRGLRCGDGGSAQRIAGDDARVVNADLIPAFIAYDVYVNFCHFHLLYFAGFGLACGPLMWPRSVRVSLPEF